MSDFRCSGCRKTHKYNLYAVAQLSQGYTLGFTCECGKETTLTPSKYRKARDKMRAERIMTTPSYQRLPGYRIEAIAGEVVETYWATDARVLVTWNLSGDSIVEVYNQFPGTYRNMVAVSESAESTSGRTAYENRWCQP